MNNSINNLTDFNKIIKKHNRVLFYFYSPKIDISNDSMNEVSNYVRDKNIKWININVDNSQHLVTKLDLVSYPCIRIYSNNTYKEFSNLGEINHHN